MRTVEELRPLRAGELMELWKRCCAEAQDPLERVLLCNARILAACCFCQGEAVYDTEESVLKDLTARQMERLLRRLADEGERPENTAFDEEKFQAMKEG